jgi:hypothetical protein
VLDQADLLANRDATLRSVFSFLGVDADYRSPQFDSELFKGGERRRYPRPISRLKPLLRAPFRQLPEGLRESVRGSFERTFLATVPKPEVGPDQRQRLVELFVSDAERLRALTGLELQSWSV